jgi:hypothetical protein
VRTAPRKKESKSGTAGPAIFGVCGGPSQKETTFVLSGGAQVLVDESHAEEASELLAEPADET